jgi:hypothetical protein
LKEHAAEDVDDGFILAIAMTAALVHDTNYLPCLAIAWAVSLKSN